MIGTRDELTGPPGTSLCTVQRVSHRPHCLYPAIAAVFAWRLMAMMMIKVCLNLGALARWLLNTTHTRTL